MGINAGQGGISSKNSSQHGKPWKGSALMGHISSTKPKLAVSLFGACRSAEPLAHQWYWFYTLASRIAYKIHVTTWSHVLFPLQHISWVHQEKGGGVVSFFPRVHCRKFEERPSPDFERLRITGSPEQLSSVGNNKLFQSLSHTENMLIFPHSGRQFPICCWGLWCYNCDHTLSSFRMTVKSAFLRLKGEGKAWCRDRKLMSLLIADCYTLSLWEQEMSKKVTYKR